MIAEVRAVWVAVAALLAALVVTYSRLGHLYHVSSSGLRGGLGRAVLGDAHRARRYGSQD